MGWFWEFWPPRKVVLIPRFLIPRKPYTIPALPQPANHYTYLLASLLLTIVRHYFDRIPMLNYGILALFQGSPSFVGVHHSLTPHHEHSGNASCLKAMKRGENVLVSYVRQTVHQWGR
jgi:hypothetical protein